MTAALELERVLMGALLIYRHKDNISKLLHGKESKLGGKAKS